MLLMLVKPHPPLEIDTNATLSGYISVTPLTLNRTNMTVFEELIKLNP